MIKALVILAVVSSALAQSGAVLWGQCGGVSTSFDIFSSVVELICKLSDRLDVNLFRSKFTSTEADGSFDIVGRLPVPKASARSATVRANSRSHTNLY